MKECAVPDLWESTDGGCVRQLIEVSMDKGVTREAVFGAEYRPTEDQQVRS